MAILVFENGMRSVGCISKCDAEKRVRNLFIQQNWKQIIRMPEIERLAPFNHSLSIYLLVNWHIAVWCTSVIKTLMKSWYIYILEATPLLNHETFV